MFDNETVTPILIIAVETNYFVDKETRDNGTTREWIAMVENSGRKIIHVTTNN